MRYMHWLSTIRVMTYSSAIPVCCSSRGGFQGTWAVRFVQGPFINDKAGGLGKAD
ncbi:MAG: hypothetical protein PHG64_12435 [Paludibacter sp.]|nr:hypothetical protein [Paludibacter sp.]